MKILNVTEENNESVLADNLRRTDVIIAKRSDSTAVLIYEDCLKDGGYCWRDICTSGSIISEIRVLRDAIKEIQALGYKVYTLKF